ncbi:MAG: HAD family hydrolase [Oscillospiraceae bacterium]|nr:HAD family hydrolase [Oscillospiraceae bacterium]
MIKAVVFDLDGTLMDTLPDIAASLNRALAACGLPTHSLRTCESFVGGGIREAVRKAAPPGTDEAVINQILDVYLRDYPLHCMDTTRPYDGVPELLHGLSSRGLLLGVLSNKTEAPTQKIIQTLLPDIPFRCVFGRVDTVPLKPDPAAAGRVLEALRVTAAEIVYAGDSGTDVEFAHRAGMLAAATPWGYRSREELAGKSPEFLPAGPAELMKLLAAATG